MQTSQSTKYQYIWKIIRYLLLISIAIGCVLFYQWRQAGKERAAETERLHCLDNYCQGDIEPKHDSLTEQTFKRGGKWFIAPKQYGGYNGSLSFIWPSKAPSAAVDTLKKAPEYLPSNPATGRLSNFYDVAIEIFIQTRQPERNLTSADIKREGFVKEQIKVREGLERWVLNDPIVKTASWYIATGLRMPNGSEALLYCDESIINAACTTSFVWKADYLIYVRFNQKHGKDWPEIYQEIIRLLNQVREA